MKTTNKDSFENDVIEASKVAPIVVMFFASWCGPCKVIKPMIERLSSELNFPLIGIDGGVERVLADKQGVRGVPTLMVFKDGVQLPLTIVGSKTEAQVKDFLFKNGVTQGKLEF